MGAKLVNAVSAVNVGRLDKEASALMARMDSFLCAATTQDRDGTTNQLINGDLRKEEENLIIRAAEFVESCSNRIIENAAASIKKNEIEEIKLSLKEMNPLIAAELLFAANYTKDISALTGREFMDNLGRLDTYVASALLYEIRLTGNAEMLTDKRLFQNGAAEFFNQLGPEAASEWFNSIGRTGNISALTSETALSIDVLTAVKGNANIASELSYAIGDTGSAARLTSREFLGVLKGLDSDVAAEYLSAIWCTKRVDELTSSEIMGMISSGEADVWKDIVRLFKNDDPSAARVIISKADGSQHDRGVKLIVQSLVSSGFDVIYTGSTQNQEEIINTAIKERANAIGFSITGEASQSMAADTMAIAKLRGVNDISFFAGGMINPILANILEQKGARLFMQGSTLEDLVNFLKVPRNWAVQQDQIGIYGNKQLSKSALGFLGGNALSTETIVNNTVTASGMPSTFLMNMLFRLNVAPMVPFWLSNPALYPMQGISRQQQLDYQKAIEIASQMIFADIQAMATDAKTVSSTATTINLVGGSYAALADNVGSSATLGEQLACSRAVAYSPSFQKNATYNIAIGAVIPGVPSPYTDTTRLATVALAHGAFAEDVTTNAISTDIQGSLSSMNFGYPAQLVSKDAIAPSHAQYQSIPTPGRVQQTYSHMVIASSAGHIKQENMGQVRPENSHIRAAQIIVQSGPATRLILPNAINGIILQAMVGEKIQDYAASKVSATRIKTNAISSKTGISKAQKPEAFIDTKTESESEPKEIAAKHLKALQDILKDNAIMLPLANSGPFGWPSTSIHGYESRQSTNQGQALYVRTGDTKPMQEYHAGMPSSGNHYGEFQHTGVAEIRLGRNNGLGMFRKILNALLNTATYCIKLIA